METTWPSKPKIFTLFIQNPVFVRPPPVATNVNPWHQNKILTLYQGLLSLNNFQPCAGFPWSERADGVVSTAYFCLLHGAVSTLTQIYTIHPQSLALHPTAVRRPPLDRLGLLFDAHQWMPPESFSSRSAADENRLTDIPAHLHLGSTLPSCSQDSAPGAEVLGFFCLLFPGRVWQNLLVFYNMHQNISWILGSPPPYALPAWTIRWLDMLNKQVQNWKNSQWIGMFNAYAF